MNTTVVSAKKAIGALCIVILLSAVFVPFAEARSSYYQNYDNTDTEVLLNQIYALMARLQSLQGNRGNTNSLYNRNFNVYRPKERAYVDAQYYYSGAYDYNIDVSTDDVNVDNNDTATFFGEVRLRNTPYAYVWFEFGTKGNLTEKTQRIKITDDESFEIEIRNLDSNRQYYVRAVAEDPSGYRTYGSLRGFETDNNWNNRFDNRWNNRWDDNNNNDNGNEIPNATTNNADNITDFSAMLRGEVEMNDTDNGLAFFVYGDDEDQVDEATDENSYSNIDEDGDSLQKVQVFSNLDADRIFSRTVSGLNDNTDYFFRMCVEYEDEGGDSTLECGNTESFETDSN